MVFSTFAVSAEINLTVADLDYIDIVMRLIYCKKTVTVSDQSFIESP
jgi:hypothetical protein